MKIKATKTLIMFSLLIHASLAFSNDAKKIITPKEAKEFFQPITNNLIDQTKNEHVILLGKKLYLDPILSVNNKISCNSCHRLEAFGVDNEATSLGHDNKRGERNSPTTFNAALHVAQFWDGRAKDVEEQALGPILNPVEMGMPSQEAVVKKLMDSKVYPALFKKAFAKDKTPLTYKNIGVAIGAFERTLITPSKFDQFLNGDAKALSTHEKEGLKQFIEIGCTTCHYGAAVGGTEFQVIGLANEYKTADLGRFNVTKNEDDKKVFKVPSLRNVAKTAPYFHDGSVKDLDTAIKLMAHHQLGEKVTTKQVSAIKAFLEALTAAPKL